MIHNRLAGPRALWDDTAFYGFYVRLSSQDRELLKRCHANTNRERKQHINNVQLMRELMQGYLGRSEGPRS